MVLPFVVAPDDDPYPSGTSVSEVTAIPTPGVTAIERHDRREARHEVNKEGRTLRREHRRMASASHLQRHDRRRDSRNHRRS
jgi:hypothetical protein